MRLIDLEERRSDYELFVLSAACITFVVACTLLYVVVDAARVSGWKASVNRLGPLAAAGFVGSILCARAYFRSVAGGRVLTLDPAARTYEVSHGLFRKVPVCAGGFDDFTAVRLETKVRRVYCQRNVRQREYWAVMLDWREGVRRPICLEETAGAIVTPKPWFALNLQGEHHRAQAALQRWAHVLGVPATDLSET